MTLSLLRPLQPGDLAQPFVKDAAPLRGGDPGGTGRRRGV
jgi:hypothetical protein